LISLFLKNSEAEVVLAENGNKAVEEVVNQDFDLILMDIQMPGMDGHEAMEKIRSMGRKIPIVALTAHALKSEHEKCLQSGCNSVLTKPITQANLIKELHHHIH